MRISGASCHEAQTQTQTRFHDPVAFFRTNYLTFGLQYLDTHAHHTQPMLHDGGQLFCRGDFELVLGVKVPSLGKKTSNTVAFRNSVCYRRPDRDAH